MFKIVLVEPEIEENIGSVARVMKNFGFDNLIILNPKCKIGENARRLAKNAGDILKKAKIITDFNDIKAQLLVATTSKLGTDYNLLRTPIIPKELLSALKERNLKNIAIIFGRESSGLLNKELEKCHILVSIPCSKKYPAMNLSHAVAVILYELSSLTEDEKINKDFVMASITDRKVIEQLAEKALDKMEFSTAQKKETQRKLWKRLIHKSFLTKREAFALMGWLKKIIKG